MPTTPFTETGGTFVNAEGRAQIFNPVVKPLGQARPAWKVLRVLGERLGVQSPAFTANDLNDIRSACVSALEGLSARLNNGSNAEVTAVGTDGWVRSTRVNPYATDAVVRRASSLQKTKWAQQGEVVGLAANIYQALGLATDLAGDAAWVVVKQGDHSTKAQAVLNPKLADNVVDIHGGTALAAALGSAYATVKVERA